MDAPPAPGEQLNLVELLSAADAWAVDLISRHLDPASRLHVFRASRECQLRVLESADQFTITLVAYSGLSDAAWQRRLASAEQALVLRCAPGHRGTKLVLRIPTSHHTALQSILSISAPAGRAVTEFEVQAPSTPIYTPYLQALPAAFPNLRSLQLKRLRGLLPAPEHWPHLRELKVQLCRYADDGWPRLAEVCASIALYTLQLTSLDMWVNQLQPPPWESVFTASTNTLTRFSTECSLTHTLLRLLCTHAPNLQRLACYAPSELGEPFVSEQAGAAWGVCEVASRDLGEWVAQLPRCAAPQGVTLRSMDCGETVQLRLTVADRQGLSPAVQQCIPQWRIPKPCRVTLSPPDHDDLSVESLQAGIEAALRHLSGPLLPLGSTIQLASSLGIGYRMYLRAAAAAIAATAPALPHVTVYPPPVPGGDRGMAELVALQPPLAHACILYPQLSEAHANVPWPWQSLRVAPGPAMPVEQLTRLPDPTGGQYEIACQGLRLSADELTPDVVTTLKTRLPHMDIRHV